VIAHPGRWPAGRQPGRRDRPALAMLALVLGLLAGPAAARAGSAAGPGSGTGGGGGGGPADPPARSLAEARARHAEALRRCDRLAVAAVRAECRRQADRVLATDRARLARGGALP